MNKCEGKCSLSVSTEAIKSSWWEKTAQEKGISAKSYKTICANCHGFMKGDKNATVISHGICNKCTKILYPEYWEDLKG